MAILSLRVEIKTIEGFQKRSGTVVPGKVGKRVSVEGSVI